MKVTVDGATYKVWFIHVPTSQHEYGDGITYAKIADEDGSAVITIGAALCSAKDTFSKAKGRKVALSRALKQMWANRQSRRQVWEQLFAQGMKP